MKKLLAIIVLGLLFSGNAYTENIFDCETDDNDLTANVHKGKLVIKVDDNFEARLKTGDPDTGKYREGDLIMSAPGAVGEVIVTSRVGFVAKGSYDLFVSSNTKKGDNNYFKGLFVESAVNGLIHSLTINVWEENMPIYIFLSDNPQKVIKGNCK